MKDGNEREKHNRSDINISGGFAVLAGFGGVTILYTKNINSNKIIKHFTIIRKNNLSSEIADKTIKR